MERSQTDARLRCAPDPALLPLVQWEANEHARASQAAQANVADCVAQVTAQFPERFKPAG